MAAAMLHETACTLFLVARWNSLLRHTRGYYFQLVGIL